MPCLRSDVGSQHLTSFRSVVGKQEVRTEVELVIPDGLSLNPNRVIEVVHYLSITDEGRTLNPPLELIPRVKDEGVTGILVFEYVDHVGHILESSVGIVLEVILSLHEGGKSSTVNVIGMDNSNGGVLRGQSHGESQERHDGEQHCL